MDGQDGQDKISVETREFSILRFVKSIRHSLSEIKDKRHGSSPGRR